MFGAGEVITLQPGSNPGAHSNAPDGVRADWSPEAQLPDPTTGIMAHTPDPSGYHKVSNYGTMVPRSTRNGGSQGFSTAPGVLNIDPANPVTGGGGLTVDLGRVTKQSMAEANAKSGGNPVLAWQLAGGIEPVTPSQVAMPAADPRTAPPNQPGYVVPHGTVGGAQQEPISFDKNSALFTTQGSLQNPSVKPPKGKAMTVPTMIQPAPAPQVQGEGAQVQSAPHPQAPVQQLQPAMVQPAPQPAQPAPQPVQPDMGNPAPYLPPPQPQPVYPPQQPYIPPQPAPPTDPNLLAVMQGVMAGLQDLKQSFAAPKLDDVEGHWSKAVPSHVEEADKVVTSVQKERAELQRERDEIEAMRNEVMKSKAPQFDRPAEENPARGDDSRDDVTETDDDPQLAVPESTELGFLTNPPSRPRIPVMINLGTGGSHLKRFHHVTTRDIWLSLIFDSRYEGDQFIPPVTKEGEPPIQVTFPDSGNQTIQCVVPESCNMRIGCMDIINFLIVQPENTPEEPTQDEFAQHNDFKHLVPEGLLKAAGK